MAARRQVAYRQPQRKRNATDWARVLDNYTNVAAGTKVLLGTVILSNPGIGEVVRRTRGLLSVTSDQASAMESQIGAIGMIVVNDLALAAGAASIPGPVTDLDDDGWFVWQPFAQICGATVAGITTSSLPGRYDFDSKAMRRIEQGFGIAIMAESIAGVSPAEVSVNFSLLTSRT